MTGAIARVPHRYLRTTRHPAAVVVGEAASFDDLYEAAGRIEEVYAGIVEELVAAAGEHGEVLYAVPGSPVVAEHTVERLLADDRVAVELVPGLSFLDLAWVRLGVDPVDRGVRLVDGHRFAVEAAGERGPLLVAQCDNRDVLSDIKLAVDDVLDRGAGEAGREPTAVVLQRLGLPDEAVIEVPWPELDRAVDARPPHVGVPAPAGGAGGGEVAAFAELVRRLRAECPWDREQTHQSLRRHLLEETYEVLEALDHLDVEAGEGYDALEEELGDLLFQVVFHARLAAEEGRFTLADVARGMSTKLVGRHPHVFGDAEAASAEEVADRWEQIKRRRRAGPRSWTASPPRCRRCCTPRRSSARPSPRASTGATCSPGTTGLSATGSAPARTRWTTPRRSGDDAETELRLGAEHVRDRFRAHEKDG